MPSAFAAEVTRLHDFFQGWFCGDSDLSLGDFSDALADDFVIISPGGTKNTRDEIVGIVERARDSARVEITIAKPRVAVEGDVTVGTYEEHQIRNGRPTKRISTAVLTATADTPGGWLWNLVHETWLPADQPDQA